MNVDFIIVGQGLAGTCFACQLLKHGKSFIIIDQFNSKTSSRIALGVYNPLVLKWVTKAWNIDNQIDFFYDFYNETKILLNDNFIYDIGIYKFLNTPYEQNNWLIKSANSSISKYMSEDLFSIQNNKLAHTKFYGFVNFSGRIDVNGFLKKFRNYCIKNNIILEKKFNYNDLSITSNSVIFQGVNAKQIIFCEGYGVVNNPYFNNLNLNPTKGEYLNIYVKNLNITQIIHSGLLFIPMGNNYYSVGATYNWEEINNKTSENARKKIIKMLNKTLLGSYDIIDQKAGIRPSTLDRRPLIGRHPIYKQLYILNGLGTRGVLLAPYLSKCLLNHIYFNKSIHSDVDINRIL